MSTPEEERKLEMSQKVATWLKSRLGKPRPTSGIRTIYPGGYDATNVEVLQPSKSMITQAPKIDEPAGMAHVAGASSPSCLPALPSAGPSGSVVGKLPARTDTDATLSDPDNALSMTAVPTSATAYLPRSKENPLWEKKQTPVRVRVKYSPEGLAKSLDDILDVLAKCGGQDYCVGDHKAMDFATSLIKNAVALVFHFGAFMDDQTAELEFLVQLTARAKVQPDSLHVANYGAAMRRMQGSTETLEEALQLWRPNDTEVTILRDNLNEPKFAEEIKHAEQYKHICNLASWCGVPIMGAFVAKAAVPAWSNPPLDATLLAVGGALFAANSYTVTNIAATEHHVSGNRNLTQATNLIASSMTSLNAIIAELVNNGALDVITGADMEKDGAWGRLRDSIQPRATQAKAVHAVLSAWNIISKQEPNLAWDVKREYTNH